jgi:hypothetical protein
MTPDEMLKKLMAQQTTIVPPNAGTRNHLQSVAYATDVNIWDDLLNQAKVHKATTMVNPAVQQNVPVEILGVRPMMVKAERAISRIADVLPFSIVSKINRVALQRTNNTLHFTVIFSNDKFIDFYDIENFPNDAQIGRIAMECP